MTGSTGRTLKQRVETARNNARTRERLAKAAAATPSAFSAEAA